MGEPVLKTATYQDLLAVPSNRVAEILNGRLVTQPRPAPKHACSSSVLDRKIGSPFHDGDNGGPGGWIILVEPELHLGRQICVPDLAGWRRENMPSLPETAWFETPPDWICEVLSPSAARYDRNEKREIYADFGVSHLWFVDPDIQTLEAFELRDKEWVLIATLCEDAEVAVAPFAPFAAVPFGLGALWAV